MDNYAKNVNEAVEQLAKSLSNFHKENRFYNKLFSKEAVKDAWEDLREHCQQLSGWIGQGRGVTQEMKPGLCKILFAAEKVLLNYRQYSRRKLHYK